MTNREKASYRAFFLVKIRNKMHIQDMESDVKDAIDRLMVQKGKTETLKLLAEKTGKSSRTILRWIENGLPDGHSAYLVALACGMDDERATLIGRRLERELKAKRAS